VLFATAFDFDLRTGGGKASGSFLVVNISSIGIVAPRGNKFCSCAKVGKFEETPGISMSQPTFFFVLALNRA
jgi:hypothetical protein